MNRDDFRSGFEYYVAQLLADAGVAFEYEPCSFEFYEPIRTGKCNGCGSLDVLRRSSYTPDFYLPEQDIYIEAKGKFTPQNRTRMLHVVKWLDWMDLRMVFQRDNYLTKTRKNTYGSWCEQKGIPYAVDEVPHEWIRR